jgi:probable F420-dependent oxidoreductase
MHALHAEEVGDAVGDYARLSTTGGGEDEQWPVAGGHRFALRRVQTLEEPIDIEHDVRIVQQALFPWGGGSGTRTYRSHVEASMDIGCHLPTQGPVATREALLTFSREAEARGIASLWVSDHVVFPRTVSAGYPGGRFPHPPDMPYLEPVAVLAAAAMCTTRARIGASVFILGHRHPIVMAKMLTTIDALSGGRLICGVGVGWWAEELEALGVPFHARGRQANEMLRIFKELWTADKPAFSGEFYRFADLGFAPKPIQKPHPPLWVGGDSPGAFRRVVTLGDGWHATSKPPTELRAGIARLRAAADEARRDFSTITLSVRVRLGPDLTNGSPQPVIDQLSQYKGLGVSHVMLDFRRDSVGEMVEILDRVTGEIRSAVDRA